MIQQVDAMNPEGRASADAERLHLNLELRRIQPLDIKSSHRLPDIMSYHGQFGQEEQLLRLGESE
jgi:hypothetical protein